jgi:hypothetical protein
MRVVAGLLFFLRASCQVGWDFGFDSGELGWSETDPAATSSASCMMDFWRWRAHIGLMCGGVLRCARVRKASVASSTSACLTAHGSRSHGLLQWPRVWQAPVVGLSAVGSYGEICGRAPCVQAAGSAEASARWRPHAWWALRGCGAHAEASCAADSAPVRGEF